MSVYRSSSEVVELAISDAQPKRVPLTVREEQFRSVRILGVSNYVEMTLILLVPSHIARGLKHANLNTVCTTVAAATAFAPLDVGEIHVDTRPSF